MTEIEKLIRTILPIFLSEGGISEDEKRREGIMCDCGFGGRWVNT
jgi:hypothetical protein